MKPIAFLLLSSGLFLTNCSKKSTDPSPTPVDKPGLLTAHDWRMTGYTMSGGRSGQTGDYYALLASCARDDYYHFDVNGTFHCDEGATKCTSTDPQTKYSGTWRYDPQRGYLYLTGMPFLWNPSTTRENYMDPFEVSATQLKIVFNWNDNGIQTKETITMVPR